MRLALSIVLVIASLGILIHAYFSPIRPYDIMLQSIRMLPRHLRKQPLLVFVVSAVMVLMPVGALLINFILSEPVVRTLGLVLWQGLATTILALVALRIHRSIVQRDFTRGLRFGARERRMMLVVLGVWTLVTFVGLVPRIGVSLGQPLTFRVLESGSSIVGWVVVVFLAFAGPAASFDDMFPYRRSLEAAKRHFTAIASIVMLSRGLFTFAMLGVATTLAVVGPIPIITILALPLVLAVAVAAFLVAESALAIALTRIFENVYDEDTRGRDYNADWH